MTLGTELFIIFVGSGILTILLCALSDCWRGE